MSYKMVKTTIRFDPAQKMRAQKYAIDQGWSLSKLVYLCLRDYLDGIEKQEAARIKGPKHPDQQLSDLLAEMGMDIYDQPWNYVPRPGSTDQ